MLEKRPCLRQVLDSSDGRRGGIGTIYEKTLGQLALLSNLVYRNTIPLYGLIFLQQNVSLFTKSWKQGWVEMFDIIIFLVISGSLLGVGIAIKYG